MKIFGIFLLLVVIVLAYLALSYHVVKTDTGNLFVKKKGMRLSETFVDVRQWKTEDLDSHPALTDALIAAGRQDLVDKIDAVGKVPEQPAPPVVGGLGGIENPIIESQSGGGAQTTGHRTEDRARALGNK